MWSKKLKGLVSKMVGSGHGLIALRLVRSKLRKREETNNNSLGHGTVHGTHPTRTHPAHPLPQLQTSDSAKVAFAQSHPGNGVATLEAATIVTTTAAVATATAITAITASTVVTASACADGADGTDGTAAEDGADEDEPDGKAPPLELFLWSYPAQQLSPYSGTKDTLVRELPCEVPQDSKGLRKNLRGKWKRLVKRKPEDTCSIPPELRDQLKQIYVY